MSSMARDLATIERHFPLIEEADGKQKKRYRIERNDDPDEAISGREFLDQIPEKIAARMIRVLEAVAEAPTHV